MASNKATINLTPLEALKVERFHLPGYGYTPNTSLVQKPLFIYRSAFNFAPDKPSTGSTTPTADLIEKHLRSVGVVEPQWRYTMYSRRHFHSTTHEVLVVSRGRAKLCFGGGSGEIWENRDGEGKSNRGIGEEEEEGGGGAGAVVVECRKGDVMVVPAGVAHRLEDDLDGSFQMVGSYPPGFQWDMCYGLPEEEARLADIKTLEWFERDPVYGDQGPVLSK